MEGIVNTWEDNRRDIANLWKREVGVVETPDYYNHSLGCSDTSVCYFLKKDRTIRRLDLRRRLEKHVGSVNTLQFNADGVFLMSGSDDQRCILWNWQSGLPFSIHTGHTRDILNVQFMPCSNDSSIVTSAADGQVRHFDLSVGETFRVLAERLGKVHKMAIVPGCPHTFYACSGHGFVTHFDLRTRDPTMLFRINDTISNTVHLYDIANDPTNTNFSAVAGSDVFTRIYDIRKCGGNNSTSSNSMVCFISPKGLSLNAQGISSLAYSNTGDLLASYQHSDIYLFSKDVVNSGLNYNADIYGQMVYKGHRNELDDTVQRVSFLGPDCEYVTSGSDSGHAFIWRKSDGKILRALKGNSFTLNCVEPHPQFPVLATGGIDPHIKVWAAALDRIIEPDDFSEEIENALRETDIPNIEADYNEVTYETMWDHVSFRSNDEQDSDDENSSDDTDDSDIGTGDMEVDGMDVTRIFFK